MDYCYNYKKMKKHNKNYIQLYYVLLSLRSPWRVSDLYTVSRRRRYMDVF